MPIQKLTKRVVDAITSGDKTVIYYDSELTGFCLKVLASGGKRWCVEYRSGAGGRSVGKTRMVLGSTSSMTPDQARQGGHPFERPPRGFQTFSLASVITCLSAWKRLAIGLTRSPHLSPGYPRVPNNLLIQKVFPEI